MKWNDHRNWARLAGISDEASIFVDSIIDLTEEDDLPPNFRRMVDELASQIALKRGANTGNSALAAVLTKETILRHDPSRRKPTRGKIVAEIMVRILTRLGDEYLRSWHIHHHLDYLGDQPLEDWDLEELIAAHKRDYPATYSQEVAEFLMANERRLRADLERIKSG